MSEQHNYQHLSQPQLPPNDLPKYLHKNILQEQIQEQHSELESFNLIWYGGYWLVLILQTTTGIIAVKDMFFTSFDMWNMFAWLVGTVLSIAGLACVHKFILQK